MGSSIPLVANTINTQPQDPLAAYSKAVQLKSLLQAQQQQEQMRPLQLQQAQQATQEGAMNLQQRQSINSAYHDALSVDPNTGAPSIDEDKLTKSLAQNNQGSAIPGILEGLTKWKQANATLQESQQKLQIGAKDSLGLLGSTLQQAKYDPNLADLLIEQKLRTPGLSPQEGQQLQGVRQQIQQNPAILKQLADSWVANSPQQQTLGNAREVARIRANTVENQQMNDWLAKNPDKTASDYPAAKAAGIVNAETPAKIAQATQTAQAELPIKAATAGAEAQARIAPEVAGEVAKAQALAPKLEDAVKTTGSGQKYLDLTNLKGPEADLLQKQALAQGIPVADKATSTALSAIDTARQNQQFMLDQISSKLASGAPERLWYGPKNTIEKIAQTDPTLAAIGDYRSAAIQSMRAVAGSGGLRINQAEIKQATDNDIPKMTDTLPVAQQKLKNMQAFLDHTESGLLTKDRSAPSAAPKDLGPAPQGSHEGQTGKFNGQPAKVVNGRLVAQ